MTYKIFGVSEFQSQPVEVPLGPWQHMIVPSSFAFLCWCTATKIQFICSFSGNCAASVPIFTFICLWAIPRIGPHISCRRIGRSIEGTYKSLTDTWIWQLGLWPRNSFSGNICFEFSVLVLCSVDLSKPIRYFSTLQIQEDLCYL
jgi:hypothetical protein